MGDLTKQDHSRIPTSNKYTLLNNLKDSTSPKLSNTLHQAVKPSKSADAKAKITGMC